MNTNIKNSIKSIDEIINDNNLINDVEIFEGIVGGLAWTLFVLFFRQFFDWNPAYEGAIAWALTWYFRKIFVRIYKTLLKDYKESKNQD